MGQQYNFGVGYLTLIPPAGSSDMSPQPVGTLKEASIDITFSTKELVGSSLFPVDIARSAGKITGKAKSGSIKGSLLTSILTGGVLVTGTTKVVARQSTGTLPAASGSPSVVTYDNTTNCAANVFGDDLGAYDDAGTELMKVTAAKDVVDGKYHIASSIYTFGPTSATKKFTVSYSKKDVSNGKTVTYANQLMGTATTYQLTLFNHYSNWDFGIKLYAVIIPKLAMAFKNEDYTDTDIDFEAFADSTGNVLDFYSTE